MTLQVALAFDKASVREFDKDGRMRVAVSHLSCEQVADYLGREIPGWDRLGLLPNKVYSLYRPAEELEKAASTFNQIPILSEHVHVTAANSRPDLVVGATGTDAEWVAPYLDNSLVLWTAEAIALVESDEQKELSCSYHYTPVIKSGTFKGQRYDIVMTDLIANHVALVAAGRAGPTVVVGDQLPKELSPMSKTVPSRLSLITRGALLSISPMLAADSKLDLSSLSLGITADNWAARKPTIVAAVTPALAHDADVGTLHKLLDGLDGEAKPAKDDEGAEGGGEGGAGEAGAGAGAGAGGANDPGTNEALDAVDADPCAELMASLAGKLPPEDMAAFEAKLRAALTPKAAADAGGEADPITPGTPKKPETKEDPMLTQTAMDAALAKNKAESIAEGRKLARDITEAEKIARPYVGEMPAMDSAEAVYKAALTELGVDTKGMHPSAFRAVLQAQPKPGGETRLTPRLAMDGKNKVAETFPHIARIKKIG